MRAWRYAPDRYGVLIRWRADASMGVMASVGSWQRFMTPGDHPIGASEPHTKKRVLHASTHPEVEVAPAVMLEVTKGDPA